MNVAVTGPTRFRPPSRIDSDMRRARTCYDHLAGELGVALTDAMIERRYLALDADAGELTAAGSDFLVNIGIDLTAPVRSRRAFCRPCLDWSERRPHLAGRVGAAIADLGFARDWIRRRRLGRSVEITESGAVAFRTLFGREIDYPPLNPSVRTLPTPGFERMPRLWQGMPSRHSRSCVRHPRL
jgi:hypothetical protein